MLVYTCKHYARVKCGHSPSHTPHFAQSAFVLYFVVAAVVAIVSIFCVSRTWLLWFFQRYVGSINTAVVAVVDIFQIALKC